LTIWAAFARWTDQIAKKKELSTKTRALVVRHRAIADAKPFDSVKMRLWIIDAEAFADDKKHDLAALARVRPESAASSTWETVIRKTE